MTETLSVTAPAIEPTEPAPPDTYRPHLDGLRAVAVYLVVLFHAGLAIFSGGYIGVDVFFVLSGYLVTQLLLRDVAAHRCDPVRPLLLAPLPPAAPGRVRRAHRHRRRVHRDLLAGRSRRVRSDRSRPRSCTSANWYFIHHASGYFGADISTNPVLPFWSLAVEEQFYLLWPLTLGGHLPAEPPARASPPDARRSSWSSRAAHSRRPPGRSHSGRATRTTPTTAPTPGPTSCSPARCSRSHPRRSRGRNDSAAAMLAATVAGLGALLVLSTDRGSISTRSSAGSQSPSSRACSSSRSRPPAAVGSNASSRAAPLCTSGRSRTAPTCGTGS